MTAVSPLGEDRVLKVPDGVLARRTGDEMVLLNLGNEQYYGLDEVGTRFWELVEAGRPFGEAIDELDAVYVDVDRATLVADLTSLVGDLAENGLVALE